MLKFQKQQYKENYQLKQKIGTIEYALAAVALDSCEQWKLIIARHKNRDVPSM